MMPMRIIKPRLELNRVCCGQPDISKDREEIAAVAFGRVAGGSIADGYFLGDCPANVPGAGIGIRCETADACGAPVWKTKTYSQ